MQRGNRHKAPGAVEDRGLARYSPVRKAVGMCRSLTLQRLPKSRIDPVVASEEGQGAGRDGT